MAALCVCRFGRPTKVNPDEIIQKFAAKEAEFREARNNYTYRQSVKMQELDAGGNPTGGKWEEVEDIIFSPEGKRIEKVVYAPVSTLQQIIADARRRAGSAQRPAVRADHDRDPRLRHPATWARRRWTRSAATRSP